MPSVRSTPQTWHRKNHRHPETPVEECWQCGRDRAVCRRKLRFDSIGEAEAWVLDLNITERWANPVTRYPCRWCPGWHMTRCRNKTQLRRTERARRRWLTESLPASPSG